MNADRTASPVPADAARSLQLGPLVRTDEHWAIGDHTRKAHLALPPEGMEHRVVGRESKLVTWDRFRGTSLQVACDPAFAPRSAGFLSLRPHNPWTGAALGSMLRDPEEDWTARFSHHHARHPARHILLLRFMLLHTTRERRPELPGDDEWLTQIVVKLRPLRCHQETTALRPAEETLGDLHRRA